MMKWLAYSGESEGETYVIRRLFDGSRHKHIRYLSSNYQFITNWDPVFDIKLC